MPYFVSLWKMKLGKLVFFFCAFKFVTIVHGKFFEEVF